MGKKLETLLNTITNILGMLKQLTLKKSEPELKTVQPKIRRMAEDVVAKMFNKGYAVTVFEGFRSFAEQDYLYQQGRTRWGPIVTNAKAGESLHNYGVAVDIVFLVNGHPSWSNRHPWKLLGTVGKEAGFEWGGDWESFVDRPHFQYTDTYTLQDFQKGRIDYTKFN